MGNKLQSVPQDYPTVNPSLMFEDSKKAIDFYKKVFDAEERYLLEYNNRVVHGEIKIGNSVVMMADEIPGMSMGMKSAKDISGLPVTLYVYVKNVDETFAKAIKLGAKEIYPLKTQFYGDRVGAITDPFGYNWTIATHVKNVSQEEIQKNLPIAMKEMSQSMSETNKTVDTFLEYKQRAVDWINQTSTKKPFY